MVIFTVGTGLELSLNMVGVWPWWEYPSLAPLCGHISSQNVQHCSGGIAGCSDKIGRTSRSATKDEDNDTPNTSHGFSGYGSIWVLENEMCDLRTERPRDYNVCFLTPPSSQPSLSYSPKLNDCNYVFLQRARKVTSHNLESRGQSFIHITVRIAAFSGVQIHSLQRLSGSEIVPNLWLLSLHSASPYAGRHLRPTRSCQQHTRSTYMTACCHRGCRDLLYMQFIIDCQASFHRFWGPTRVKHWDACQWTGHKRLLLKLAL